MAIILTEIKQDHEMTAEQVAADDSAYYQSLQSMNWLDGYAILGITIAIFLVGLAARPLLVLSTIIIQLAVVFGLIFFLVSHFALI